MQARKSSQGIYSSKSIDEYTRSQYNSYGWVVINKVLTVNELNRFYKQFANEEMLDFLYKKSYDGYYMISTGDKSMVDTKIVFVEGTAQNPYIDRVVELTKLEDNEYQYFIDEVINSGGKPESLRDIEILAEAGLFAEYTSADFASYGEQKKRRAGYNAASHKDSQQNGGRTGSNQTNTGTVKNQSRDSDYLRAVESGDTETAQRMVAEAAREAGYNTPMLYHGTQQSGTVKYDERGDLFDDYDLFYESDTIADVNTRLFIFIFRSR